MIYGALAAKSAGAERIVLVVDALARASLQRRARRRRDAGLALRTGAARCRRGRLPQSRRSRALEEAGARSRRIAGRRRAGRRRRHREPAGAAVAGHRPGSRVPHDCQPRAAPWRLGILRGGDGAASARADLALPIRQPAGGELRCDHRRRARAASRRRIPRRGGRSLRRARAVSRLRLSLLCRRHAAARCCRR